MVRAKDESFLLLLLLLLLFRMCIVRVPAEISLLTGWRRMASVRAATHCSLFSLSAEHFTSLLDRFPVVRRTLESVAAQRLEKIGHHGASVVSSRADLDDDVRTVSDIIRRVTSAEASSADDTLTVGGSRRPSHAVAASRKSRRRRKRRSQRTH